MSRGKKKPEIVERICQALRLGNSRKASAAYGGITERTFYNWLTEDEAFAQKIAEAEAQAECRNVQVIQEAADRSWQAAAWWLERRRPADWRLFPGLDSLVRGLTNEQLLSLMERNAHEEQCDKHSGS